ncbi:response regulator [Rhizobium sp. XQZ8]|jgi:DNA-binding response OmpR family regulator|uniref:response regulator n=1 Tax=Rhizobium populisoli TaxID=2859785 RepID=UPI001CA4DD6A|nr:response regulator [Rhizobium populisoli]MBW6423122.1 response regulator [Rhizobium populisoli]
MALRILVVEDEMTIALMIEDMLIELGHEVIDLAMRLPQAEDAASKADFDLAVLDVNLDGRKSFPVADILSGRGIPYVFATGYGGAGLDAAYSSRPVLTKPFMIDDLKAAIDALVKGRLAN